MTELKVVVQNCNSIVRAEITLNQKCLNIKYGPNGIGKSTIAKAIVSQARDDGSLQDLTPFRSRGGADVHLPTVEGVGGIGTALVFDEQYVDQFAFQQDEVVKNSFDIFVKTPDYDEAMKNIEDLFVGVKEAFQNNPEIEQATKDLKDLRDAFGTANKDGSISKSSKVIKAFGSGNKVDNIPEALQAFETFIKDKSSSKWIGWQIKGNEYLKLADSCPYCARSLASEEERETVLAVAKEYDAAAIGHLNNLKLVIERLGVYFSEACQKNLEKVTKAKLELGAPEKSFLSSLKTSIEALIAQLEGLRTISFYSLRDVDEIEKKLNLLKIDLGMIDKLNSPQTRKVTEPINVQLEDLIRQIGTLKGHINSHKAKIKKSIELNQKNINSFLQSAGYKYSVVIIPEPDSYKMKLVHEDSTTHVESAAGHLSYGERNAFALVLFMHQVVSENPDLVILDDPISSFDKNKKFAILHQLFTGKGSLRDRTTLLLTHDLEPAIDVVKGTVNVFKGSSPSASFLSSSSGQVEEKKITRNDIQTFAKICDGVVESDADKVVKCIYLRRHYEIVNNPGMEYNLLASLFKKRDFPTVQSVDEKRDMTATEKAEAEMSIRERFPDFDYDSLLAEISDPDEMKAKYRDAVSGYEKIQLFRIVRGKHDDDVISKFINESYHIENEYVVQLDPRVFESVPEYVVDECNRLLEVE